MARSINPLPQYIQDGKPVSGGKMFFFAVGTTTPKNTFNDPGLNNLNTHPVLLDAQGRVPKIFFNGEARQVLTDQNDVEIFDTEPVGSSLTTGAFTTWDGTITYAENAIVEGSDQKFYISIVPNNLGNDPTTPSPSEWSEIRFIGFYNAAENYDTGDVVQTADGFLWASQVGSNIGNDPSTDTGTNWLPAVNGAKIPEVTANTLAITTNNTILTDRTTTSIPQTGATTLTALRVNELQDSTTFLLPLANSVLVNQWIIIDLPDTFQTQAPVVAIQGSDTITDRLGSDTTITFAGPTRIILFSDGVSVWRL